MRYKLFNHTPAPGFKNLPGYNLNERLRLLAEARNHPKATRAEALETFIEDEILHLRLTYALAGQPVLLRSQALDAAKRALGSLQRQFGEERLEFIREMPALVLSESAPAPDAKPAVEIPPFDPAEMVSQGISGITL